MGALDCVSVRIKPTDSTEVFTVTRSELSLHPPRRDTESQKLTQKNCGRPHWLWWTFGVDVPLFLLVAVLVGLFELGVIPQHKSGFFCNDPALSFPFQGDTVSMQILMCSVILLPFVLIFITEFIFVDSTFSTRMKFDYVSTESLKLYRNYFFGLNFNLIIIEVMKGITGNPRPTFFDICEPDTAKTCNGSEYVSTFECTSTRFSKWYQSDSYHSFPSGHTSLSLYCGFFMAWYLQRRAFSWRNSTVLLVPLLQLLCITYVAICSLTRITDHRHHWWDVLTGAVVGIVTFVFVVSTLCDNFKRKATYSQNASNSMTDSQQTVRTLVFDGPQTTPVP
ncbi:phospholipid phosphatase 2-like [Melitaea cinxia]|uniref:phospholipid phosphatase 2-like n=1 Tax=Melitaea cinxia TaxID=113334 RepID=UPI001E273176|nr:phospholipid phosphatase 2-like [Melitaea cinxia]